jgi:hypothetical protein
MNDLLDYAIRYQEQQFSVFPLAPKDKKPKLSSWKSYQNTRADKEQIVSWQFQLAKYQVL